MARKNWLAQPDAKETFSRFCAPTALAGLMGCTRLEAADMLMAVPNMTMPSHRGAVDGMVWKRFLIDDLGGELLTGRYEGDEFEARCAEYRASYERRLDAYMRGERARQPKMTNYAGLRFMTVSEFLRRNPTGKIVLSVNGHTFMATDGKVTDDTLRTKSARRRVDWAVRFAA